jgi:chemotaxis response regulator CheB
VFTVLLVDRSDAMRRALRAYLTLATELEVVGEASNDDEARALVERLRPNVVVVVHALNPDAFADAGSTRIVGKHQGVDALLAAIRMAARDHGY